MKWYWVTSPYRIKSHFVPETLLEATKEDLISRVPDLELEIEDCSSGYFDLPGMMSLDAVLFEPDIDGLKLEMPAWQVEEILYKVKNLEVRFSADEKNEYYKLHGYCRCLVLTTEQRDRFISQLEQYLPTALAISDLENEEFNKAFPNDKTSPVRVKHRPVRKKTLTGLSN